MTGFIKPPDLNSYRSRFADWLELLALTSRAGEIQLTALKSLMRRVTDGRSSATDLDADADDGGEPEITDRATDDLVERIVEELTFRAQAVGESYPFVFSVTGGLGETQKLTLKSTWRSTQSGELFYVFCLIDSGIRDGLIDDFPEKKEFIKRMANVFQICSCVAVGGYTGSQVVSFGFPRATGDGFLPALHNAWKRYGSYDVRESIAYGMDSKLKDGGVDIISWHPFRDALAATLLMFVQVASGLGWKDKPVANDVKSIKQWFVDGSFEHFTPAICIPFTLWFDLEEPPRDLTGRRLSYATGIYRKFMSRETAFGVIFDRGRIAQSAAKALSFSAVDLAGIDGADKVSDVEGWVDEVMSKLRVSGAVAA